MNGLRLIFRWNMISLLKNNKIQLGSRILLAAVFIFAGIEKAANPGDFSVAVSNYRILPLFLINITAIFIPWLELSSGILLLFGKWIKANSLILTALLIVFNVLIIVAILRGLDIECGCFGTLDAQMVGLQKLAENFFLIFVGLIVYKFSPDSDVE